MAKECPNSFKGVINASLVLLDQCFRSLDLPVLTQHASCRSFPVLLILSFVFPSKFPFRFSCCGTCYQGLPLFFHQFGPRYLSLFSLTLKLGFAVWLKIKFLITRVKHQNHVSSNVKMSTNRYFLAIFFDRNVILGKGFVQSRKVCIESVSTPGRLRL